MKTFLFLNFLMLFLSCNQSQEKIILTQGLSEDPYKKRVGIEIGPNSIFYCQEMQAGTGIYSYYKSNSKPELFIECKKMILTNFTQVNQDTDISDGQLNQIIYIFEEKADTLIFGRNNLSKEQNKLVDKILEIQTFQFIQSNKHQFPELLLKERLPPPPISNHTKENQNTLKKLLSDCQILFKETLETLFGMHSINNIHNNISKPMQEHW